MLGQTMTTRRRALLLAVLVSGLLLGLVGMHHLAVASEAPAPVAASSHLPGGAPADQPPHEGGGHDSGLLHLCLAVLTVVAVLVASVAVWRCPRPVTTARRSGMWRMWTAPRAPPSTAPARLALLCVLRT